MSEIDIILPEQAGTLAGLFRERIKRSPDAIAYQQYDIGRQSWVSSSWSEMGRETGRWQQAIAKAGLVKGDRVALMLRNRREWVLFDQAAMGLGLVTVPLYVDDRPDNAAYILKQAGCKLLLVAGKEQWQGLLNTDEKLPTVQQIISVAPLEAEDLPDDKRLTSLSDWLFGLQGELQTESMASTDLATLVYTSGTTGRPKGVMLSHASILANAYGGALAVDALLPSETFLSFLPLSHMFERTVGYYLPMMCGYTIAFSRSIPLLSEDIKQIRPTCFVSVPRIYERVYGRIQERLRKSSSIKRALFNLTVHVGNIRMLHEQQRASWSPLLLLWPLLDKLVALKIRQGLGGRMRLAICGGAALPENIGIVFNALGLRLLQGYGLTEASPVVCVNKRGANKPASIGFPLHNVTIRISDEGELQTRSGSVMLGYWENEEATKQVITEDGWLRTGDLAKQDEEGFVFITGRLKEIIVLSNGEKVPPADMENAIVLDPLIDQVLVYGDGQPCLVALAVLNKDVWHEIAPEFGVDADDEQVLQRADIQERILNRLSAMLKRFPGYAQVKAIHLTLLPWTVEEGLMTPTLKIKRTKLVAKYTKEIESLYNLR